MMEVRNAYAGGVLLTSGWRLGYDRGWARLGLLLTAGSASKYLA